MPSFLQARVFSLSLSVNLILRIILCLSLSSFLRDWVITIFDSQIFNFTPFFLSNLYKIQNKYILLYIQSSVRIKKGPSFPFASTNSRNWYSSIQFQLVTAVWGVFFLSLFSPLYAASKPSSHLLPKAPIMPDSKEPFCRKIVLFSGFSRSLDA